MKETGGNGLLHFDPSEMERFLNEWSMKIQDPNPDEEAEMIANRNKTSDKANIDPSRQQVP